MSIEAELQDEINRLRERQQELLATIARLSKETPYADELQGWTEQRAKMIAEIGTLNSRVIELEDCLAITRNSREFNRREHEKLRAELDAREKQWNKEAERHERDHAAAYVELERLREIERLAAAVIAERQPALKHARETAAMCKLAAAVRAHPDAAGVGDGEPVLLGRHASDQALDAAQVAAIRVEHHRAQARRDRVGHVEAMRLRVFTQELLTTYLNTVSNNDAAPDSALERRARELGFEVDA